MISEISGGKLLITGGSGFLGRYVVAELISKGIVPTVLTRNQATENFEKSNGQINFVELDLLDFSLVRDFIETFRPERIIHLAGKVYQSGEPQEILEKLNYEATVNLLKAAAAVKVEKIIMTGTADEYGFQTAPQIETMTAMPASDYAVSKNKAVKYALTLHAKYDLPVVILRPFTIYGVGQPPRMFVAQAVECAVRKIPFEMSKGEQKRDLLFVTDFVNAIIKFLTANGTAGEIYNIGSGRAIALKDLARKIWDIAGADAELLKIGARQTNAGELHDTQADVSKIRRALNWQPKISLDEGLKLVVEEAKKNQNEQ